MKQAASTAKEMAAAVAAAADSSRTRGMAGAARHPFRVRLLPEAALVMDIHSHCARTEIIGLLAGSFDRDSSTLWISRAFACRALAMEEDEAPGSSGMQD